MPQFQNPLDNVKVAAPCSANWDAMVGNHRVRFCGQCSKNVYNLSAMSRPEAERLIVETEGNLCVRFYQRQDGSILTENCPVGVAALRKHMARVGGAIVAVCIGFFSGISLYLGMGGKLPFWSKAPVVSPKPEPLMGAIAPVPPPTPPTPHCQPTMGKMMAPVQINSPKKPAPTPVDELNTPENKKK